MISKKWKEFLKKKVRLIINDVPYPRPKDGIIVDIDDSHIFLLVEGKTTPTPFLKNDVKRVELKEGGSIENATEN